MRKLVCLEFACGYNGGSYDGESNERYESPLNRERSESAFSRKRANEVMFWLMLERMF